MVRFKVAWWVALGALIAVPAHAQLYKHTDDKGNVVYSDRPKTAGQTAEKKSTTNVATPDARRQIEQMKQDHRRNDYEEAAAARRRAEASRRQLAGSSTGRGYDPYGTDRAGRPAYRRDPNLPDSPPPDAERRYFGK